MAWLESLHVEVAQADLFSMSVEAVVVNTETDLSLSHSLGRTLLERSGDRLRTDIDRIRSGLAAGKLALGQAVTAPAYGLGTIRYAIVVACWDRDNPYSRRLVERAYTSALRQAFEHRVRSVALPLMGTGSFQMDSLDLHEGIVK